MLGSVRAALPILCLLALGACVERRLWIRTEPEGAFVRVNGDPVGTSPVSWRFFHYGVVLVEAELAGHVRTERAVRLRAPWYETPGLDFFADVLVPVRIHDRHEVTLELEPEPEMSDEQVERAVRELAQAARARRDEARREADAP